MFGEFRERVLSLCLDRCTSIEFIVTEKCQNACKYCYRVKKHQLSNKTLLDPADLELYIRKLKEIFGQDIFHRREIELFGGDALLDFRHFKDILKVLCNNIDSFTGLVIPTNARLVEELLPVDTRELFEPIFQKGIRPGLSFSIDLIDTKQRPLSKIGKMLDYSPQRDIEKLVKKSFELSKLGFGIGYHPMFDFSNIDDWSKQFYDLFKHNLTFYILEVRHPLSKEQAVKAVREMCKIRLMVDKTIEDPKIKRSFNTILPSRVPRGLGCSAHTSLCIDIDGNIPFCHRVMDPPWIAGNIVKGRIDLSRLVRFKMEFDHRNHPMCSVCPIRTLCSGQCAGASYEYWGDPWTPIESICWYFLLKMYVMSQLFSDWKDVVYSCCNTSGLEVSVRNIFGSDVVTQLVEYLRGLTELSVEEIYES